MNSPARYRRLFVPVVTAALLAGIFFSGGLGQPAPAGAERYFEEVASAIDSVPYQIRSWYGVELPFTEVVVQMLRPNKILRRTFQDPALGHRASLSIIHCTDVRDMLGHHPPVCYPAHGWHLESRHTEEIVVRGRSQEVNIYHFSRLNAGSREAIRIVSFFVAPGVDGIIREMDEMERASKRSGLAGLGAAQVQVLTPLSQSQEATGAMVSGIVEAIEPVIEKIGRGVE